jgi:hypothetical protein
MDYSEFGDSQLRVIIAEGDPRGSYGGNDSRSLHSYDDRTIIGMAVRVRGCLVFAHCELIGEKNAMQNKRCRGCLTVPASELDLAWSGYVETVERLVVAVDGRTDPLGLNVEKAVRQLDVRISDAIMHAMENGPVLEEKVSASESLYMGWFASLARRDQL